MPKLKEEEKKTRVMVIKVAENEYSQISKNAQQYTNGNISRWIRYAAIKLSPKQEDFA